MNETRWSYMGIWSKVTDFK